MPFNTNSPPSTPSLPDHLLPLGDIHVVKRLLTAGITPVSTSSHLPGSPPGPDPQPLPRGTVDEYPQDTTVEGSLPLVHIRNIME